MRILVVHGDNNAKSFEKYRELINSSKSKGWEIKSLSTDEALEVSENLASNSLFSEKILFVLDDFQKLKASDFKWLKKHNKDIDGFFLVYSPNLITKTNLKKLPEGFKEEVFNLPKVIWKFLDSVYPKNTQASLSLLKQVEKKEPQELVFHLLARHLRDLYRVRKDSESLHYPSWRVGKLRKQASKFKSNQLENLIKSLLKVDRQVKTSKGDLSELLDFTLASNLE